MRTEQEDGFCNLGAEYPSPKRVNLSIMVGLYQPKRLKVTYSATKVMKAPDQ